jgi:MraZ protein
MVIPEYLRSFGNLKKEVIVAGLYSRLEIWNKESWEAYKKQTESESSAIAEKMSELGV